MLKFKRLAGRNKGGSICFEPGVGHMSWGRNVALRGDDSSQAVLPQSQPAPVHLLCISKGFVLFLLSLSLGKFFKQFKSKLKALF